MTELFTTEPTPPPPLVAARVELERAQLAYDENPTPELKLALGHAASKVELLEELELRKRNDQ